MQTEGRPRPPPGNTVITIITYRALILISPSYVSLSPPRAPPPPPLSLPRRFVRTYLALPLAKRESLYILFPRNLSREPINTDSLLSPCRVTLVNGRLARPRLCLLAFSTGRSVERWTNRRTTPLLVVGSHVLSTLTRLSASNRIARSDWQSCKLNSGRETVNWRRVKENLRGRGA